MFKGSFTNGEVSPFFIVKNIFPLTFGETLVKRVMGGRLFYAGKNVIPVFFGMLSFNRVHGEQNNGTRCRDI